MLEAEYRKKLKQHHICRDCKKIDAYTLSGRTYCYECAEKNRIAKEKARQDPEKKERMLQQKREHLARYREQHRCLRCGRSIDTEKRVCEICAFKQREAQKKSRGSLPRTEGVCWQCNKNPVMQGKRVCAECYPQKVAVALQNLKRTRTENHPWRKELCDK